MNQRARRRRSATESLLSIVLGMEAVLMFFVTATAYGLKVLPAPLVLGGGAACFVLFLLGTSLVRYPAGVWFGWILQLLLIGTGIVMVLMYFVGAGFAALWTFCLITGRRLDSRANWPAEPQVKETS